ncbi:hypothetical protein [Microbacterium sp. HJ5]
MSSDLRMPWVRSSAPVGWTVTVRCAADVHPADARPVVMIARCVSDGAGQPPWSFELRGRSVWAALDTDRGAGVARMVEPREWLQAAPARMAYRLRCSTCPEDVPIGDEFALYDLMEQRAVLRKRSDTLQRIRASRS